MIAMQPKFLKFDNLGSLRDYWAVSETQKPILNEKDFSNIKKIVSEYYEESGPSNGNNAHLIELAQSADIRQVAFEICARLVSEGHTALLLSESGSVYSDLAGQQNKLFALIIEQKSNIPGTPGVYSAQLSRSINEAILHKKFSFPVLFLKDESGPNHGNEVKILATKVYREKNGSTFKLWSLPILLFVAGFVLFYHGPQIFLSSLTSLHVITQLQQFIMIVNLSFIISYVLMAIGIAGIVISAHKNKSQTLRKGEYMASILLFFLFLLMIFPYYILIPNIMLNSPSPANVRGKLVLSSLLEPFLHYLSQVLVSPFWLDTWEGQIFLGSTIFLSISVAIYIILGLRENLRVSVIYLTLVALDLIVGSFTALFSPLWNLVASGSLDQEALSVYNLMSLIEYLTNLVVPVTCLFYVFRNSQGINSK
jgi:hypothetical protein